MTELVQHAPRFTSEKVIRIVYDHYGLITSATPLPSERDQNFELSAEDGRKYVLKLANSRESAEVLDLQNCALAHIQEQIPHFGGNTEPVPRLFKTLSGETMPQIIDGSGNLHFMRLLSFVPGKPYAQVRPHHRSLERKMGRFLGRLDAALERFEHAAAKRDFYWDLQNAGQVISRNLELIEDPAKRSLVDQLYQRYESETRPALRDLPMQIIHADCNDHNLLVSLNEDWEPQVSGVIDFGDMVYTFRCAEVAIAAAYAMLGQPDPIATASSVVSGYHEVNPLHEDELEVIFILICIRLCMSVCIAARQSSLRPGDDYLTVTRKPAWTLLERIIGIHPRLAYYTIRGGCGRVPCPATIAVTNYLLDRQEPVAAIVPTSQAGKALILDLSVESSWFPWLTESGSEPGDNLRMNHELTERIWAEMRSKGAEFAVGRYREPRLCYSGKQFASGTDESNERRTIHLGIDLFLEPGTPVYAPLPAIVHSFADNSKPQDYGPTLILEHRTDQGEPFYTLYGHLSQESLSELEEGQSVEQGEQIASIGESSINGGWPPHLHFQIITDVLDEKGTFPGVSFPSQRLIWESLCPDPKLLFDIPNASFVRKGRTVEEILAARRELLAPSLSISYRRPLKIVRGLGQQLFDEQGIPYLDVVNNVCHVGHCHPRVVEAAKRQLAVLNTNTRYLHDLIIDYSERLLALFPAPLSVCFFVCSGSEANELALRLARAHTGRKDVITVEGAYHGNTQALIDISPYKHNGPGGAGPPEWVSTVPIPDGYRGRYRDSSDLAVRYASHVREAAEKAQRSRGGAAAFICESLLGCGGQIVLPAGYLKEAFKAVRQTGGVCIVDEVQVGFGRVGTHYWGFETQDVIPDIVTLGKPIGNGHPIGAVVTTRAIADSFANGMEYFNTFGGNPVSCSIALEVLSVIEEERLQENAHLVGRHLLERLKEVRERFPLVGDVRGKGLFAGVELVLDRDIRTPAPKHAAYIANRMRDHGILISTDGPAHNVLKIKPPLVFSEADANRVTETLAKILGEDCLQL